MGHEQGQFEGVEFGKDYSLVFGLTVVDDLH